MPKGELKIRDHFGWTIKTPAGSRSSFVYNFNEIKEFIIKSGVDELMIYDDTFFGRTKEVNEVKKWFNEYNKQ